MMCATPDCGRRHGHCGLAAEPGPRLVETLKELGVTAVGHRLKLLHAIAALRGGASPSGAFQ